MSVCMDVWVLGCIDAWVHGCLCAWMQAVFMSKVYAFESTCLCRCEFGRGCTVLINVFLYVPKRVRP